MTRWGWAAIAATCTCVLASSGCTDSVDPTGDEDAGTGRDSAIAPPTPPGTPPTPPGTPPTPPGTPPTPPGTPPTPPGTPPTPPGTPPPPDPPPPPPSCTTDDDCEDGDPCTEDGCWEGACGFVWDGSCECVADANCEDGDPCTTNTCLAGHCELAIDLGCSSGCRDFDADGDGDRWCGGSDCDDFDPTRSGHATESCTDGIDNDCDGLTDAADDPCRPTNTTCAAAAALTPGERVEGSVVTEPGTGAGEPGCGRSLYWTVSVPTTSDVTLEMHVHDPPPPVPVPGCPECTPETMFQYWYNVFLEQTCGDPTTAIGGGAGGCYTYERGFGGGWFSSNTRTVELLRVPAGTYALDVQAKDFFGWMTTAIGFDVTVTVTPSDAPACDAGVPLVEGTPLTGSTAGGANAFGQSCNGDPVESPESIHVIDLAEPRRVRVEATGRVPMGGTDPSPVAASLYEACDPDAERLVCQESLYATCAPRTTIERILPAGRHWLVVESRYGGEVGYDLALRTEAVGEACAGAATISASGAYEGDTTGAEDRFRDSVCGGGEGPDRVYALTLTTHSRVVLDLIASYDRAQLSVFSDCGSTRIAGGTDRTRVDRELDAGTYYVVVGGQAPETFGTYVLNTTILVE